MTHDPNSGQLHLYYGAADTSICVATAMLDDVLEAIREGCDEDGADSAA
jgi:predicted GH43/DUF377 family glycosyl hydrolase